MLHPPDEYTWDTPRSSVEGFINAARARDYPQAAQYLDLRALPSETRAAQGAERARQLQIVLERALWIDLTALSPLPEGRTDDELPAYRERVGTIETKDQTFDILLQRVSRDDGGAIWQVSAATVYAISQMYAAVGYGPLGEME